jgi:hypothetical protein
LGWKRFYPEPEAVGENEISLIKIFKVIGDALKSISVSLAEDDGKKSRRNKLIYQPSN